MDRISDVVVVGGGIVGCAIAYELARRGVQVQVIERRLVGSGATQASAGVLAPYVEAYHRSNLLELATRSLDLYDDFISHVVEDSGISVQYRRTGTLEVAADAEAATRLFAIRRMCASHGVGAKWLNAEEARNAESQLSNGIYGALLIASHGFVGAYDLTEALRRSAVAHGTRFLTSQSVVRVTSIDSGVRIETSGDTVTCASAVIAAGSWSGLVEITGAKPLPVHPVRGQLLHLGWREQPLTRVVWSDGCYLVPWGDGSVLVGATVEKVGFDERSTVAGLRDLIEAARQIVPGVVDASFEAARVGLRPATPDEMPIIGQSSVIPGLVYATGHFRNGILLAPITGMLVAGLIVDHVQDAVLDSTAPSRFGEN